MEAKQELETRTERHIAMKKTHLLTIVGAIVMMSFFVFVAQAAAGNAGNTQNNNYATGQAAAGQGASLQAGKQVIQLSVQGLNYYPNPIRLKKDVPAILEVDTNSVRGCLRGIQIPAFGIRKTVNPSDNKIEFTPDKAGTFGFSCFMGMGKGQIVVEDQTGNVPADVNTVAKDIPSGGSCGAGGGCGCGG